MSKSLKKKKEKKSGGRVVIIILRYYAKYHTMYNAHTSVAKYNKDYFMIKAINIVNIKISMVRHDSFKVG